MSKLEKFKAAFLPDSRLAKNLGNRVRAALSDLDAATTSSERLVQHLMFDARRRADQLEQSIMAQVEVGTTDPGAAWVAMADLERQAAALGQEVDGRSGADLAAPTEHFNRALDAANEAIATARAGVRDVADDDAAEQLLDRADERATKMLKTVNAVRHADNTATQEQADRMAAHRDAARTLIEDVRAAARLAPADGSQRAVSRAVIGGIATAVPAIGQQLNDPNKDHRGRTAMDDARARLDVFDAHFVRDEDADPTGKLVNKAMRLAAITAVGARRIAMEQNDPNLQPLIARSLVGAYADKMTDQLAKGDDDPADAEDAVALAQAMVMDDPVGKLMTGKINPEDAVQRIRDMAQAAGIKPSEMLKLLRQQFEMDLGSLSGDEVRRATRAGSKTNNTGFEISETTGELSERQFTDMVGTSKLGRQGYDPTTQTVQFNREADQPQWQDDGSGLKLKPTSQQVHVVVAGDTPGTLAQAYLGDPARWKKIIAANRIVPVAVPSDKVEGSATEESSGIAKLKQNDQLPVGATLRVPGQESMLDQLAPYVDAWDDAPSDRREPRIGAPIAPRAKPAKASSESAEPPGEKVEIPDSPLRKITPETLAEGFANLKSPRDVDPEYIQAPGLPSGHAPRAPLDNVPATGDPPSKATKPSGTINERQYAHLRLLARADEEDAQEVMRKEGKSLDDAIAGKIAARYELDPKADADRAKRIADAVAKWIASVPLTVTFTGKSLFSDPGKNEPTHGKDYGSDVVYSRGEATMKDMIGKEQPVVDPKADPSDPAAVKVDAKVGVTGGKKTGWEEKRGENYMRWRRNKDDREGRHDELPYEDQQVFAAANPYFDQAKGGSDGRHGANYYGDAHFLLKDAVRERIAFIVRAGGKASSAVQRKDIKMLIYDMLTGGDANAAFVDALLNAGGKTPQMFAGNLNWEAHLYGGFDMSKDAQAIYLSNDVDPGAATRIEAFAKTNGIRCEKIGALPQGMKVLSQMPPTSVELPA